MNALKKILLTLFGIVISMMVSIGVMMNGWGLEPKSWFWIIGVSIVGQMLAQAVVAVAAKGD
jgi:hypothetical protein